MKTITHLLSVIMIALLLAAGLAACSPGTSTPPPVPPTDLEQPARQVLENFLVSLHLGRYEEAYRFYGGSYEMMIAQNPLIDPQDHATLLQNACTTNGFLCLQWQSIELEQTISETEFVFTVQFQQSDGSLFVLGPCCGATETEFPPLSSFSFRVSPGPDGTLLVMDMVPYMP